MSKLHEEALAAGEAALAHLLATTVPTTRELAEAAITARDAHLAAHGVKLTPREPTEAMLGYGREEAATLPKWRAMHDAAPDWPGDA